MNELVVPAGGAVAHRPIEYVSLHSHTTFSFGDGYGPVTQHVSRIEELGMKALAVTEHGNVSSWVELEKACRGTQVKPIFGIEIYFAPPKTMQKTHMILLAMNSIGLQNINRIVTQSWRNFYRWPTVHLEDLEANNEGIIALSGCSDSALSCTLYGGKYFGPKTLELDKRRVQLATRLVERFSEIFDQGRYFLECQRFPLLERTCLINQANEKLSARTGVPLVATSDVHYCKATDQPMQKILHAAHRGSSVDVIESQWEWDVKLTYPTSDLEIFNHLIQTGMSEDAARQSITNTGLIADRCNVELPKAPLPRYLIDPEKDWKPWT